MRCGMQRLTRARAGLVERRRRFGDAPPVRMYRSTIDPDAAACNAVSVREKRAAARHPLAHGRSRSSVHWCPGSSSLDTTLVSSGAWPLAAGLPAASRCAASPAPQCLLHAGFRSAVALGARPGRRAPRAVVGSAPQRNLRARRAPHAARVGPAEKHRGRSPAASRGRASTPGTRTFVAQAPVQSARLGDRPCPTFAASPRVPESRTALLALATGEAVAVHVLKLAHARARARDVPRLCRPTQAARCAAGPSLRTAASWMRACSGGCSVRASRLYDTRGDGGGRGEDTGRSGKGASRPYAFLYG